MKGRKISTDLKYTILAMGGSHSVSEIAAITAVSRRQIHRIRKNGVWNLIVWGGGEGDLVSSHGMKRWCIFSYALDVELGKFDPPLWHAPCGRIVYNGTDRGQPVDSHVIICHTSVMCEHHSYVCIYTTLGM